MRRNQEAGEHHPGRGKRRCKGPESGVGSACSGSRQAKHEAGEQMERSGGRVGPKGNLVGHSRTSASTLRQAEGFVQAGIRPDVTLGA